MCLGILATPRLHMTNMHQHTHNAVCASMWRRLDGVRAAYLSVCDRLTARAPSTLSTIITSRNTHTHKHTRTLAYSDNVKMGQTGEFNSLILSEVISAHTDENKDLKVENTDVFKSRKIALF